MSGDRERTIGAGCDDYHAKPVDFARLVEQIERHLAIAGGCAEFGQAPPRRIASTGLQPLTG
jgi:DNA-binding response OmpR family regulator